MGTLWKIALRNTVRHKRRTVITAIVMTAGISTFIVFDSMLSGMDRMAIDNMERFTVSSLKVRDPAYVDDIAANPLDKPLKESEEAIAALAAIGAPATPRVRFVARLSNYSDEIPVLADAVDPARDGSVFKVASSVAGGAWLEGAPPKSVVLGAALADELKLKPGDSVLVSAQTVNDTTNADEYEIVGTVDTPAQEVDRSGFFMSLADARELLAADAHFVTEVDAALPRAPSLKLAVAGGDKAAELLRARLPGMRVDPISYLAKDYLSLRNAKAKYSYILIFVVLLIAAVGIVNTILMSIYSRVREIGVLRAYGMTRRDISRLFLLEGLAVGLVGSALGVAAGCAFDLYMTGVGIDLTSFAAGMGSIPIAGVLRGEWNPGAIAFGFFFGLAVSLVAAQVPARKAARLEPTEALRFQ
jgi:ABC-type lipoprotein release transport system permease subunit